MASTARQEILGRIREALQDVPRLDPQAIAAEWQNIDRDYTRAGHLDRAAALELLEDRLRDYDAQVLRAAAGEISQTIAQVLAAREITQLVIPAGLAEAIGEPLPQGIDFVLDTNLTATELDRIQGVMTTATVAIAETGTIVLQNVPGQGRRAPTLIPDYHLCIVRASDVVETVPEAMARLAPTAALATTFISGPSATADIEMTRIKGVHGPRFLDVILVP
jgi:L-lactate dehydrogenase complex protein LldG